MLSGSQARSALLNWRKQAASAVRLRTNLDAILRSRVSHQLAAAFGGWRRLARAASEAQKSLGGVAAAAMQRRQLRGSFQGWRAAAGSGRTVREALLRLRGRGLKAAFEGWVAAAREGAAQECTAAAKDLAGGVRRRALLAWRARAQLSRRLEGLQQTAEQMLRHRRIAAVLAGWKARAAAAAKMAAFRAANFLSNALTVSDAD